MIQENAAAAPGGWRWLDDLWDFFASVKVAISLVALLAIASAAGSLVEQENLYQDWRPPELYYPFRYGPTLGPLLQTLGLTHAYTSAWFLALIFLTSTSLIVCSLQRVIPLHRALNHPRANLPASAFPYLPIHYTAAAPAVTLDAVEARLRRAHYKTTRAANGTVYAERGRLGRYGPYIIHIGLLLCALAALTKYLPGWDIQQGLWIADGETVMVPTANFAIRSDGFTAGYYDDGRPKLFETRAVILQDGQEVLSRSIQLNDPLAYQGYEFFQASFKSEPGVAVFDAVLRDTGKAVAQVDIDLKSPAPRYQIAPGVDVVIGQYFPDAGLDDNGNPVNQSRDIKNPVFFFYFVDDKGREIGRQVVAVSDAGRLNAAEGPLMLQLREVVTRHYTGLRVHKDRSAPFWFSGVFIVFGGMLITFFIFHRQVWARVDNGTLLLGARTKKFEFGLKQELQRLLTVWSPPREDH